MQNIVYGVPIVPIGIYIYWYDGEKNHIAIVILVWACGSLAMEGTDGYICMGKSHTIVSMSMCSGPVQQVPSLVSSNRSPEVFVLVTNSK